MNIMENIDFLCDEVKMAFDINGVILCESDYKPDTILAIINTESGYVHQFHIQHDGTEETFLTNVISAINQFNGIDLVDSAIDICSDMKELRWWVNAAEQVEIKCRSLGNSLLNIDQQRIAKLKQELEERC